MTSKEILDVLDEIEKEHPYKVIGRPETYSSYNEAWRDAVDRVRGLVIYDMKHKGEKE